MKNSLGYTGSVKNGKKIDGTFRFIIYRYGEKEAATGAWDIVQVTKQSGGGGREQGGGQ